MTARVKRAVCQFFTILSILCITSIPVSGLSCFICNSYNNSNPHCGDPFHSIYTRIDHHCIESLAGLPGRYCIKVKGHSVNGGIEMTVRRCSMQAMDNICGLFLFGDTKYKGCTMSCQPAGCNTGSNYTSISLLVIVLLSTAVLYLTL